MCEQTNQPQPLQVGLGSGYVQAQDLVWSVVLLSWRVRCPHAMQCMLLLLLLPTTSHARFLHCCCTRSACGTACTGTTDRCVGGTCKCGAGPPCSEESFRNAAAFCVGGECHMGACNYRGLLSSGEPWVALVPLQRLCNPARSSCSAPATRHPCLGAQASWTATAILGTDARWTRSTMF